MIFDTTNLLSDAQAITADAASSNIIDLGATGTIMGASGAMERNIGHGVKIPLLIQITEAFDNLTSLNVKVQVDTVENFASPTEIASSGEVALADLIAGKVINIDAVPRDANQRYMRLYYDVTGTNPAAGAVTAGIVMGIPSNG